MSRTVALTISDELAAAITAVPDMYATADADRSVELLDDADGVAERVGYELRSAASAALNGTPPPPPATVTNPVVITQQHSAYVTQLDVYSLTDLQAAVAMTVPDEDLEDWVCEHGSAVHSQIDIDRLNDTTSVNVDLNPRQLPQLLDLSPLDTIRAAGDTELAAAANQVTEIITDQAVTIARLAEANTEMFDEVRTRRASARTHTALRDLIAELHPETLRRFDDGEI